jgi:hypothetical protein
MMQMNPHQSLEDTVIEIADELDEHIESKNPEYKWEAHVKNFGWQKKNGTMDKFEAKDGQELLNNLLPQTENHFTIFEFKKTGFAINNKHHDNMDGDEWYYVLPACKEGFHRDWSHDGICSQDQQKIKRE